MKYLRRGKRYEKAKGKTASLFWTKRPNSILTSMPKAHDTGKLRRVMLSYSKSDPGTLRFG